MVVAPEAGPGQIRQRHVGVAQVGPVQPGAAEVGLAEVHDPETRASKIRALEVGAEQHGAFQVDAGQRIGLDLEQRSPVSLCRMMILGPERETPQDDAARRVRRAEGRAA